MKAQLLHLTESYQKKRGAFPRTKHSAIINTIIFSKKYANLKERYDIFNEYIHTISSISGEILRSYELSISVILFMCQGSWGIVSLILYKSIHLYHIKYCHYKKKNLISVMKTYRRRNGVMIKSTRFSTLHQISVECSLHINATSRI